jgi:hypothetical protein
LIFYRRSLSCGDIRVCSIVFTSIVIHIKGKGKVVPVPVTQHHAKKAYCESGCIVTRITDLSTRWRCVVSFTPRPFYPQGKSPWYPLERRVGRPQSRSGRGGEEKNSQTVPGLEPLIIQPVDQRYTTELSRLVIYI